MSALTVKINEEDVLYSRLSSAGKRMQAYMDVFTARLEYRASFSSALTI